jgi:hypothetical protein
MMNWICPNAGTTLGNALLRVASEPALQRIRESKGAAAINGPITGRTMKPVVGRR